MKSYVKMMTMGPRNLRIAEILLMLALFVFGAKAAPVSIPETGVIGYLEQFGYLPARNPHIANSMTEESLSNAISTFQSYMGLNVTGNTNEETISLMKTPRCGLKDRAEAGETGRSKRYAFLGNPWDKRTITYRVSKYSDKLKPRAVDQVIAKAFRVWAQHVDLDFRPVPYGQVDMDIVFARGWHSDENPFDGPGMILAHAYSPGSGIMGDVHFDEDENWTIGTGHGDAVDFFQIAVHEIGHALGLQHSNVRSSIMWPTYRPNIDVRLDRDDVAGIQALYGKKNGGDERPVYQNPWINEIFPRQWRHPRYFGWY